MPIYEYVCENCGEHLEIMQRVSDEPLNICPKCQQSTLVKLISAAGFRLSGSGWYETDFKQSDKKKNLSTTDSETQSKPINDNPAPTKTENNDQ